MALRDGDVFGLASSRTAEAVRLARNNLPNPKQGYYYCTSGPAQQCLAFDLDEILVTVNYDCYQYQYLGRERRLGLFKVHLPTAGGNAIYRNRSPIPRFDPPGGAPT